MVKKKIWLSVFLIVASLHFASALVGSIGNSKMIVRVNKGQIIERYINVKNSNSVPINVSLSLSQSLKEKANLLNESFILQPLEEQKAYFTVDIGDSDIVEGRIYIKFLAENNSETGVGLSSQVVVILNDDSQIQEIGDDNETDFSEHNAEDVSGGYGHPSHSSQKDVSDFDEDESVKEKNKTSISHLQNSALEGLGDYENIKKIILAFCVALLIVALVVLVINYSKTKID